jgi:hypothetical protein
MFLHSIKSESLGTNGLPKPEFKRLVTGHSYFIFYLKFSERTITGAIIGVGSTQHISGVRWGLAQNILWAWVITIPAAATVSCIGYYISGLLF